MYQEDVCIEVKFIDSHYFGSDPHIGTLEYIFEPFSKENYYPLVYVDLSRQYEEGNSAQEKKILFIFWGVFCKQKQLKVT